MRSRRLVAAAVTSTVLAGVLAGCSAPVDPAADGVLRIVASTNVYGDLAATVGGPDVDVTSIIDDPTADPHGFEANARVQLAIASADIVIVNGGGYDDFVDAMLEASGNDRALVVRAVDFATPGAGASDVNEHVWYDYGVIVDVVYALAGALAERGPDRAEEFRANAAGLAHAVDGLADRAAALSAAIAGANVIVTEPVPLALLAACGFTDLTPMAFSAAIEEDVDVPPALLHRVLMLVASGDIALVVVNQQTGGPQSDAVIDAAADAGVPWIGVTETLPPGTGYVAWQSGLLDLIASAVGQ